VTVVLGVLAQGLVLVAAAWTVGALVAAAFLTPCGPGGVLGSAGRAAARVAAPAAWAWAVAALVAVPFALAVLLGIDVGSAARPDIVGTYAFDLPTTRLLLLAALVALVVAVLVPSVQRVGWAGLLATLALGGAALPGFGLPHGTLNDHGMPSLAGLLVQGSLALWLGSVIALRGLRAHHPAQSAEAARRHARGVPWYAGALALGVGLLALVRIPGWDALRGSAFGWTALATVAVALGTAVVVLTSSHRLRRPGRRVLGLLLGLGTAVTALAVTTPPAGGGEGPRTVAEQLIGGPLPDVPTLARYLAPALDSVFIVGCLLAGSLYAAGLVRLHRRGDRWPMGRTVSWFLGLLSVWLVTATGVGVYAPVTFSAHMVQHMTLSMLSPILLVLGAPLTLALRALHTAPIRGQRGPREWLSAMTHSRYLKLITHPFVALGIYVSGLFGLYFTAVFGWLMGSHLGHVVMLVHFLAAGYLFFWTIIGIDPMPREIPYWARFVDLLASMGVHAFFGVVVMMATTPIASGWYTQVAPEWLGSTLRDQYSGGGIAWAFGELPSLIIVVALAWQWSRSDERDADRYSRQAERDGDAELAAYNAHLARLHGLTPDEGALR
jgi:putative copper resistance protein D